MMTTSELITLAARFAGGITIGLFFFGGLAWTVRRLPGARHPAVLVLTSFVVRMSVTVAGLALLGGRKWQHYLAAMVGFVFAKLTAVTLQREKTT